MPICGKMCEARSRMALEIKAISGGQEANTQPSAVGPISGQVCQGLMSLTTRAVTKRLGAAFLLVRALLGSYWPYG